LPLTEKEVNTCAPFSSQELLYRRVSPSELTAGILDPSRMNSISFSKEVEGAPSLLRGLFSSPFDVLDKNCCDGKDKSGCLVYYIEVAHVPSGLPSGEGVLYAFYPMHNPLPSCGAHSVLACYIQADETQRYIAPSRKVRNDLRTKLANQLLPISQSFDLLSRKPLKV
jgi:hypothetical protein